MKEKYVAFLRGINVGGHHKVPMADLRKELEKLGYENIITLLNSGNIIFETQTDTLDKLEKTLSEHLESCFGFPIPTIVRKAVTILALFHLDPFKDIELTKSIRLYVSFLKNDMDSKLKIPWTSSDKSFRILDKRDNSVLSVLDLSVSQTPKAMEALEKNFGKEITTRNWNTILRIEKKLKIKKRDEGTET